METVRDTRAAVVREVQRREAVSSRGGPPPLMGIWPMAWVFWVSNFRGSGAVAFLVCPYVLLT